MAAVTTKNISKPAEQPQVKQPPRQDTSKARDILFQLGGLLGPKSEAKRLLDKALGQL